MQQVLYLNIGILINTIMNKPTFKQYLESKEQLRQAVTLVPIAISEYEVVHYCSLFLGEYEEDKISVSLKPKQKIIVEWQYDSPDTPTPLSIKLSGVDSIDEQEEHQTFWTNVKIQKWLRRHTRGI